MKVHTPALEGKANEELCSFLAGSLGLSKRSVRLLQGDASRKKLVEIKGMSREEAITILASLTALVNQALVMHACCDFAP